YVATSSAKAKIRNYMRSEQRERSKGLGKELLDRELKRYGLSLNKVQKSGELERAVAALKQQSPDDLLISIGYGKVLPTDVIEAIVPEDKRKTLPEAPANENPVMSLIRRVVNRRQSAGIKVAGEDDVLVRFAKCC